MLPEPVGGLVWVGGVCCICLHVIYFPTSFAARPAHAKLIDSLHTQQVLLLLLRPPACFWSCCYAASIPASPLLSSLFICSCVFSRLPSQTSAVLISRSSPIPLDFRPCCSELAAS